MDGADQQVNDAGRPKSLIRNSSLAPLLCEQFIADAKSIRKIAGLCLKRVPLDKRLRLLGVRAATLVKAGEEPAYEQKRPLAQSGQVQAATESTATDQLF